MEFLLPVLAYLLGSVPSGVVVARLLGGTDPRSGGSGNIGATNVLRTLGPKAAILTLLGDIAKGVIPVLAARALLPTGSAWIYLTAGAAVAGHDFSFLLKFRGGKGVATTVGTLAILSPATAGMCLVTWVAVVAMTRYSSAGALVSALLSPLFAWILTGGVSLLVYCLASSALLVYLHRGNISRLADGTEKRISLGSSKTG